MLEKIKEAIEQLSSILREDDGDVEFIEYTTDKVVKVLLKGHCAGCPYSQMTVKNGIEQVLKNKFGDEITAVEAVNA